MYEHKCRRCVVVSVDERTMEYPPRAIPMEYRSTMRSAIQRELYNSRDLNGFQQMINNIVGLNFNMLGPR
jgi:hypothetical protein